MAHVITFTTSRFDIATEPPNPINPIGGHSVLAWLRGELDRSGWRTTDPDAEDWGWYIDASGSAGTYLVGASADAHEPTPEVEWTIQVHKKRSLKNKLLGGNKMSPDDPLSALVERILRADPAITAVDVDRNAV
jgi:hypothetical protein